jgi:Tol biopolymer transport system component
MRVQFRVVLLVALLLIGTNVLALAQDTPTPEPTPTETPTLTPTATETPTDVPTAPPPPTPSETATDAATLTLAPSETPTETATLEGTASETATASITPTGTEMSTVTPTGTASETPTAPPGLFLSSFNDFEYGLPFDWFAGDSWYSYWGDQGAALEVAPYAPAGFFVGGNLYDAAVETRVSIASGALTLTLRLNGDHFYNATLLPAQGRVELTRSGQLVQSLAVNLIANSWQSIRLTAVGSTVIINLNGADVITYIDSQPLVAGGIALSNAGTDSLYLDDLKVWTTQQAAVQFAPALAKASDDLFAGLAPIFAMQANLPPLPGRVAYTRNTPGNSIEGRRLHIIEPDGSNWEMTPPDGFMQGYVQNPSWSPLGDALVYTAQGSFLWQLSLPNNGHVAPWGARTQLWGSPYNLYTTTAGCPTWSPSGRFVLARLSGNGQPPNNQPEGLYLVSPSGTVGATVFTRVVPSPFAFCGYWSPSTTVDRFVTSKRDVPAGDNDLYLYDVTNPLSPIETRLTNDSYAEQDITWSPDGTRIVYSAYVDGDSELFMLNLAQPGSAPIRLTTNASSDFEPAWSPNSNTIAYYRGFSFGVAGSGLWLMSVDNPAATYALPNGNASDRYANWSPDGTQLVITSRRNNINSGLNLPQEVYAITVADGSARRLTDNTFAEADAVWGREPVFSQPIPNTPVPSVTPTQVPSPTPQPTQIAQAQIRYVSCASDQVMANEVTGGIPFVNMRQLPDSGSSIVTQIPAGASITVRSSQPFTTAGGITITYYDVTYTTQQGETFSGWVAEGIGSDIFLVTANNCPPFYKPNLSDERINGMPLSPTGAQLPLVYPEQDGRTLLIPPALPHAFTPANQTALSVSSFRLSLLARDLMIYIPTIATQLQACGQGGYLGGITSENQYQYANLNTCGRAVVNRAMYSYQNSYDLQILNAAARYNVPPNALKMLLLQENGLFPNSSNGGQDAFSAAQIFPLTAFELIRPESGYFSEVQVIIEITFPEISLRDAIAAGRATNYVPAVALLEPYIDGFTDATSPASCNGSVICQAEVIRAIKLAAYFLRQMSDFLTRDIVSTIPGPELAALSNVCGALVGNPISSQTITPCLAQGQANAIVTWWQNLNANQRTVAEIEFGIATYNAGQGITTLAVFERASINQTAFDWSVVSQSTGFNAGYALNSETRRYVCNIVYGLPGILISAPACDYPRHVP